MHLLFVDESGTPPIRGKETPRYFVLGAVIIPEGSWHRTRDRIMGMKTRRHIRGEMKWRYFAPGNDDERNPMRKLPQSDRDAIRTEIYRAICGETGIRSLACVCSAKSAYRFTSIQTQNDIYNATYKPLTERFQYHLQDLSKATGRTEYGIVIADHRGAQDDHRLRQHHQMLLHSNATSNYQNLVEGLFLEPSHLSIGIQLADMVAGAVWRKFERGDDRWYQLIEPSFRRSKEGIVDGFGLVRMPKANWE